jgi:uncharacterized protein with NRDE domain
MCLITFALRVNPNYPLIVAANRDEFFERPAAPAHYWKDASSVFAGRDLSAGGTWLGVNQQGFFTALTNYREVIETETTPQYISRGNITSSFLNSQATTDESELIDSYFAQLRRRDQQYNGYNLLAGNPQQLGYYSNRGVSFHALDDGIYGLSNGLLDTPWPKTVSCRNAMQQAIGSSNQATIIADLFDALADIEAAPEHLLPDTGISKEWESLLSSRFIIGETYGTRTSTVVLFQKNGDIVFCEKNFGPKGQLLNQQQVIVDIVPSDSII